MSHKSAPRFCGNDMRKINDQRAKANLKDRDAL